MFIEWGRKLVEEMDSKIVSVMFVKDLVMDYVIVFGMGLFWGFEVWCVVLNVFFILFVVDFVFIRYVYM